MDRYHSHCETGHIDGHYLHEGNEKAEETSEGPLVHQKADYVEGNVEDGDHQVGDRERRNQRVGCGSVVERHFADQNVADQRYDDYQ